MKIAVKLNKNKTIMSYFYRYDEMYDNLSNEYVLVDAFVEDIVEGKSKIIYVKITEEAPNNQVINKYVPTIDNSSKVYDAEYLALKQEEDNTSKMAELRSKRDTILLAFDKYKANVYFGIETETEEEHTEVLAYYHKLLALDEEAISNVPAKINYYM